MPDQAARLRELQQEQNWKIQKQTGLRTIAVASGKGGVGKSNLVLNLALAMAQQGQRVVILDADLGLANIDVLMGVAPKYTLVDVLRGEKSLQDIIVTGPYNLKLLPGGSGIEELANLDYYQREKLIHSLHQLEEVADILLVDCSAGINKNVLGFISAADDVIVVLTPEPTAVTDAYSVIKLIDNFHLHSEVYIVINRAKNMAEARWTVRKMETVVQRFLQINIKRLGYVVDDQLVGKAVMQQQPLLVLYPQSPAARNLVAMAKNLLGNHFPAPRGTGGFLERLLRLFS